MKNQRITPREIERFVITIMTIMVAIIWICIASSCKSTQPQNIECKRTGIIEVLPPLKAKLHGQRLGTQRN